MKSRRTPRFVDARLQGRILFLVGCAAVGSGAIQVALGAWVFSRASGELDASAASTMSDAAPALLAIAFVIGVLLMFPLCALLVLKATNVVFGPLMRFRVFLEGVVAGEQVDPCTIRDKDELQDLCRLLNEATASIRQANAASSTRSDEPAREAA